MKKNSNRYLVFKLGNESYAIPLLSVREVLAMPEVVPTPHSPQHFLGIINLRGLVLSVVDLRSKFGIPAKKTEETSIMVMDISGHSLGVVVDSINYVLNAEEGQVSAPPSIESTKYNGFVESVYRNKEDLVLILNIFKTLSIEEQAA
jgi:purine-binding chemotaxis protein CheW